MQSKDGTAGKPTALYSIMKVVYMVFALLVMNINSTDAQDFKETVQPLSGKAIKGYLYDVSKDESGNNNITYKMKGDKKTDAIEFESYRFDSNLKFLGATDAQDKKETKPDYESTSYYAYVGGANSFDVLSMKLKLNKRVRLKTWNHEKQAFVTKKTLSNETVKPKNDAGKVYLGYASYSSLDETKSDVLVLVKTESKEKAVADKFLILLFNDKLELKEKPLDLNGAYSLVYCEQLATEDVVMVFAPQKGAADASKYVYYQFDIAGNQKNKGEFKSPESAMLLTAAYEQDGSVYFFGSSLSSAAPFEAVFSEYAPIYNPGYNEGGQNKLDFKWRKSLDEKMEKFHVLKFNGNELAFASSTPIADFKTKFKTAPGDKGATAYKGRRFFIENFFVTASGEYLVAGQLTSSVSMGTGNLVDSYEDIICFHFDKAGNLKAQYGIGKVNTDKKSEIFSMTQRFFPSSDGKSIYWELMEIKGVKGYESFGDAFNGEPTFYPLYYPRMVKIDLAGSSTGSVTALGEGKYYLRRNFTSLFDKSENSITYFGHDENWKQIWVGKAVL